MKDVREAGWEMADVGWWTHDTLGGICREADGYWYFYPLDRPVRDRLGPYKTLREAARDAGTRKED